MEKDRPKIEGASVLEGENTGKGVFFLTKLEGACAKSSRGGKTIDKKENIVEKSRSNEKTPDE